METTTTTPTININDLTTEQLEAYLAERRQQEVTKRQEQRAQYEGLKNDTITSLATQALSIRKVISIFKNDAFNSMNTLYELLQEYSKRHAEGDGNFTIENELFKVAYRQNYYGTFDERSLQAEKHIIDFLNEKYNGDLDTKDLLMGLLERKKGKLDIKLVQKLYSMEDRFEDNHWKEGIRLLKESYQDGESKSYINFYEKVGTEWKLINLNFSSIVA